MPDDIQGLIEKINQEGVLAAEEKARQIIQQAERKADSLIAKAQAQAQSLISGAREENLKEQDKVKALLNQAGRDLLLVARDEINAMLMRLITQEVRHALSPEALSKIISSLIQNLSGKHSGEVAVTLNKEDAQKITEHFLGRLKEETKKQIVLKSSEEIHAGFIISFDSGKSQFDFSDKALAEYIGTYLKPKLRDILQG
ncbi:MAG: V-type ATP synthase subunit E family protein [Candidatus Omnitrophica bacterium]|nr:V-type ATP synthase subunit E family protein [Candidatus Omnitrophota bacterium]